MINSALVALALGGGISSGAWSYAPGTYVGHHVAHREAVGLSKYVNINPPHTHKDHHVPTLKLNHVRNSYWVCNACQKLKLARWDDVAFAAPFVGVCNFKFPVFRPYYCRRSAPKVFSRGLSGIFYAKIKLRPLSNYYVQTVSFFHCDIRAKLSLGGVSRNMICLIRKPYSHKDGARSDNRRNAGYPCPPRAVGRRICGFPLSAQIGITAIIAGLAGLCLFVGAGRSFGQIVVSRRDAIRGTGYSLLSLGLFALAFCIGMIGSY